MEKNKIIYINDDQVKAAFSAVIYILRCDTPRLTLLVIHTRKTRRKLKRLFSNISGKSQCGLIPLKHWLDKISYGAIYSYFFLKKGFKRYFGEA